MVTKSWKEKMYIQQSDIIRVRRRSRKSASGNLLLHVISVIQLRKNTSLSFKHVLHREKRFWVPFGLFSKWNSLHVYHLRKRDHFIPTVTLLFWSEVLYPRQNLVESQSRTTAVYGAGILCFRPHSHLGYCAVDALMDSAVSFISLFSLPKVCLTLSIQSYLSESHFFLGISPFLKFLKFYLCINKMVYCWILKMVHFFSFYNCH